MNDSKVLFKYISQLKNKVPVCYLFIFFQFHLFYIFWKFFLHNVHIVRVRLGRG